MNDEEHRYDTAPVNLGRHAVPQEKKPRSGSFRERRTPRWVYRVIAILAVCALAVLGWYNRANLAPENVLQWLKSNIVGMGVGDGFPKTFSGSVVAPGNFVCAGKNIVFASDTALTVCNSTGKELLSTQHSYTNPAVRAAGAHVLLCSVGGKNCQVASVGGKMISLSVSQNILGGAVAANGRSALISAADGYCGMLTAYAADGKILSYYWFSDYYPTAVALNPEGTQAAVTGVSAKNGAIVSAVYVIDLMSGKTVSPETVCAGNLLSTVFWDAENTVAAVGDASTVLLNPAAGTKAEYSYGGAKLTACASEGERLALGLMPYEGSVNQKLVVLDRTGGVSRTVQFTGKIQSISLFGQTAAALSEGKAYFVSLASASGGENAVSAGSDACAVALRDESSAYVLGISEVRLVNNR